jgi:hypothetical protein
MQKVGKGKLHGQVSVIIFTGYKKKMHKINIAVGVNCKLLSTARFNFIKWQCCGISYIILWSVSWLGFKLAKLKCSENYVWFFYPFCLALSPVYSKVNCHIEKEDWNCTELYLVVTLSKAVTSPSCSSNTRWPC